MQVQKGFAPILIFLLIAVIVSGYLVYSSNLVDKVKNRFIQLIAETDATANWKTYTNNKIGFTLKYPLDAEIKEIKENRTKIGELDIFLPKLSTNNDTENIIQIQFPKDTMTTLQYGNFLEAIKKDNKSIKNIERKSLEINGMHAEQIDDEIDNTERTVVYFNNEGILYTFLVSYQPKNKVQVLKYLNQVLTSFKFIPAITAAPTPIPVKITTEQQAVEKVKQLPEVQEYLKNNVNGLVEFSGRTDNQFPLEAIDPELDNSDLNNKSYLVRVYEKFSDHQQTFDWYIVYPTTGKVLDVDNFHFEGDGGEIRKIDKSNNLYYSLPSGWIVNESLGFFMRPYEAVNFTKDGYGVYIASMGSGRARCNYSEDLSNFVILKNKDIGGNTFLRAKSPIKSYGDSTKMEVELCSNYTRVDFIEYGTKAGMVTYYMPINWDPKILQEMDSIVESLRIVK